MLHRRAFLIGSISGAALAGSSAAIGCKSWTHPSDRPERHDAHELRTIAAIADTFLPGDDGTPGAHEVNAVATIVDPAYGLAPYVSEVVSDLDEWCLATKHLGFVGLSAADREVALEERMGLRGKAIRSLYVPVYEGILQLTKLAYFGGLTNRLGTNYLAFPTDSTGYAPGSAAGAWASRSPSWAITPGASSRIVVEGRGNVAGVAVSAFLTTDDDIRATLVLTATDGSHVELPIKADGGEGWIDHVPVSLRGGAAAGPWRLAVGNVLGGTGKVEMWSLGLRTDLDDIAAKGAVVPT